MAPVSLLQPLPVNIPAPRPAQPPPPPLAQVAEAMASERSYGSLDSWPEAHAVATTDGEGGAPPTAAAPPPAAAGAAEAPADDPTDGYAPLAVPALAAADAMQDEALLSALPPALAQRAQQYHAAAVRAHAALAKRQEQLRQLQFATARLRAEQGGAEAPATPIPPPESWDRVAKAAPSRTDGSGIRIGPAVATEGTLSHPIRRFVDLQLRAAAAAATPSVAPP